MSEQKPHKHVKLQIQMDDDVAQGMYVNLALVNHTEAEFTMDLIYVQPQSPKAKVRARVITSPRHTKRLLHALQENMRRYEERFGEVKLAGPSPEEERLLQ